MEENKTAVHPEIKKVVTGPVKREKEKLGSKFLSLFLPEDMERVKSYMVIDVLIPEIKRTISNLVTSGIDMLLYGETKRNSQSSSLLPKVTYSAYYANSGKPQPAATTTRPNSYIFKDVILSSRQEADKILELLNEIVDTFGKASVADLDEMLGETGPYTDNDWGWYDLTTAKVQMVRDGFLLQLPKPERLKR